MLPGHLFPAGRAPRNVADHARQQITRIEAPVESVCEGAQVVGSELPVLERAISAGKCGLEVARYGVEPLELRQISRLAGTNDHRPGGCSMWR
jgi:hypothetical protein